MISLLIIDDHSLIREGIRSLLSGDPDFRVKAEGSSCQEAAQLLNCNDIHVMLLDIGLPDMDGITFTREVRRTHPYLGILAVSMHSDMDQVLGMIDAGANGFLLKTTNSHELKQAVRTVAQGKTYIAGAFAHQFVNHYFQLNGPAPAPKSLRRDAHDPNVQFNPREIEIMQMMANEMTSQQIADKLKLSIRTIDNYRSKLMLKTGSRNSIGLLKYAMRSGFVGVKD